MSLLLSGLTAQALAGPADVESVAVRLDADGTYTFRVTVRHADEGWDHYADRWEILTPGGRQLGARILYHPHVTEQPFTREISGIHISPEIPSVVIRAHDSVRGFGGTTRTVALPER